MGIVSHRSGSSQARNLRKVIRCLTHKIYLFVNFEIFSYRFEKIYGDANWASLDRRKEKGANRYKLYCAIVRSKITVMLNALCACVYVGSIRKWWTLTIFMFCPFSCEKKNQHKLRKV